MVQNFLLVQHLHESDSETQTVDCEIEQKLANLREANITLPIIADSGLWQINSQRKSTNQKLNLEQQTEGSLAFFITEAQAKSLQDLHTSFPSSQIFLRVTLDSDGDAGTKKQSGKSIEVDLVYSSIFDLLPDEFY